MYNHQEIEKKWQDRWKDKSFLDRNSSGEKFYSLTMFSYPSGSNLHVGHWYNYGPADTIARYMRMKGYNVFSLKDLMLLVFPQKTSQLKMIFIQLLVLKKILIR